MIGGAKVDLANRRASTNLSCESWWVGVGGGGHKVILQTLEGGRRFILQTLGRPQIYLANIVGRKSFSHKSAWANGLSWDESDAIG